MSVKHIQTFLVMKKVGKKKEFPTFAFFTEAMAKECVERYRKIIKNERRRKRPDFKNIPKTKFRIVPVNVYQEIVSAMI